MHRNPHKDEKRRQRILATYRSTGSIRATVRRLHISIHVVRRVLRGKPSERMIHNPSPRPSKLDAFRGLVEHLVVEEKLSAVLIFERVRELGYSGGYSILKELVRLIRPRGRRKPTTPLPHPPGAEAQMDWSTYTVLLGCQSTVVYGFSMVSCFSGYLYVRFVVDETLETLQRLHEEALLDIGAVPQKLTYDNMTTVGCHRGPDDVWINPRFEAWARTYGFDIEILPPGRPNLHGCVERPFHYVEHNCLARRPKRAFVDLEELNRHAAWWCRERANVRQHGTHRERPVDRLARERPLMKPLPGVSLEAFETLWRKVDTDFCVRVDCNRYSVHPRHVGQQATIRLYASRLEILIGRELAGIHTRLPKQARKRNVLPEHEEAFRQHAPQRALLENAFRRLGTTANEYYEGLRSERGRGAGYHMQRILKLADRHGSGLVIGAMAHAARYGNYSADAVARVLAGRQLTRARRSSKAPVSPAPLPPRNVRQWLEALVVETADLAAYDEQINQLQDDQTRSSAGSPAADIPPKEEGES